MNQERSEQQENLELAPEPAPEPDSEDSGGQFTPSPESPMAADQEHSEHPAGGAEQQAVHVRRP